MEAICSSMATFWMNPMSSAAGIGTAGRWCSNPTSITSLEITGPCPKRITRKAEPGRTILSAKFYYATACSHRHRPDPDCPGNPGLAHLLPEPADRDPFAAQKSCKSGFVQAQGWQHRPNL